MEKYCVRHGEENDFEQLHELWEICFPEAPEFNVFFFERMYNTCAVRLISCLGEIAAALYVFPYSFIKKGQTELKGYYIYGVGTHPEMRGRGLAGILLNETLKEARECGMDLCMLVPQNEGLFAFYEKFGFLPAFGMQEKLYHASASGEKNVRKACATDIESINAIYEACFGDKLHVKRTYEEWKLLIEEFELSGGGIYLLEECGKPVSYGTYAEENGRATVREIATEDDKYVDAVLEGIARVSDKSDINIFMPCGEVCYGSVCPLSQAAEEFDFKDAYMNLMHS